MSKRREFILRCDACRTNRFFIAVKGDRCRCRKCGAEKPLPAAEK